MPTLKNLGNGRIDENIPELPRPQKNAVIVLAVLAVLIIVLWVWMMQARIKAPFNYGSTASTTDSAEIDYNNLLKSTDTDKDGLSDYDEIYVYKTSPYLEDTDSDGLTDKQEVNNGSDPTCPKGQDCTSPVVDTSTVVNSGNGSGATAATNTEASVSLDSTAISESVLQDVLNGKSDAATLRQFLISGGATKEELDQISDADLLKSYQETLDSQNAAGNTGN